MGLSVPTIPQSSSLSESPIIYTVIDDSVATGSSGYQQCLDLYVWQGTYNTDKPTSPSYVMNKYPVQGSEIYDYQPTSIFDVSSILSSYMTASNVDEINSATAQFPNGSINKAFWFTVDAYSRTLVSGNYVTGSKVSTGHPRLALDGYNVWGERQILNDEVPFSESVDNFPILSSAPVTQSFISTDVPYYFSTYNLVDTNSSSLQGISSSPQPTHYQVYDIDNINIYDSYVLPCNFQGCPELYASSSTATNQLRIEPIQIQNFISSGSTELVLQAYADGTPIGQSHLLKYDNCEKQYTPIRIAWKNRYGAFDQFEFTLVSRKSFQAETKQYKANALSRNLATYNSHVGIETYYTDGFETITVNSDYLTEDYNAYFEQLLVAEEIYLVEKQGKYTPPNQTAELTNLQLISKNIQFKTSNVDKLINYSFVFKYGTPYKLTL
tara:strand:- start:10163 stop:11479 length:1317 start_codon:yes stop_codon:yes gene_type:complete